MGRGTSITALLRALWLALIVACAAPLSAQSSADEGPQSGTLMLRAEAGESYAAVQLGTDMNVAVDGSIARVTVTQVFRNTSDDWVEGVYLYPLPDNAAVDTLKMTVGNRVIIGRIKPRGEAREIYETARQEGKRAGLVEQQRPNLFTNSVANIGPGETVLVVIEYQMTLPQVDGKTSLRLPLVVGPRYVPPRTITDAASLEDARTITAPPVVDTRKGAINPVSINVDLAPGFEPANIFSAYHEVAISGAGDRRQVSLAKGQVPQDRDFELSWISASATPTAAAYRQEVNGEHYVMVTITPPVPDKITAAPPREMIFVIDNSGSMTGSSIREAKASLLRALESLRPEDHFNVIRFDDTFDLVFETSVRATPENIAKARAFTEKLEAAGGTEMLPALRAALTDTGVTDRTSVVRQIIFLTDGSISNETEMLAAIGADKGNSRIFTVGIGSAPNIYLMKRMASTGRGTSTIIANPAEVAPRMETLIDTLSHPAMQNIGVAIDGGSYSLTPTTPPDLYAGEPLVLLARGPTLDGTITVTGLFEGRTWSRTLAFSDAMPSEAVAKLWARQRIEEIEADRVLGAIAYEKADAEIEDLGLAFHIVTSQTSLVAVDETPARPDEVPLRREDLPINLPAGWDFDHLFGGETARAALANAEGPPPAPSRPGPESPPVVDEEEYDQSGPNMIITTGSVRAVTVTGSHHYAQMLAGWLMALLGLIGLALLRRKKESRHGAKAFA